MAIQNTVEAIDLCGGSGQSRQAGSRKKIVEKPKSPALLRSRQPPRCSGLEPASCRSRTEASVPTGYNLKHWFEGGRQDRRADRRADSPLREVAEVLKDAPIIDELGEAKAETTLTEMFFLMEKQKNGEVGALFEQWLRQHLHIKDASGMLLCRERTGSTMAGVSTRMLLEARAGGLMATGLLRKPLETRVTTHF